MAETTLDTRQVRTPTQKTGGSVHYLPPVDIYETDNEMILVADMPGVTQDRLTVEFDQGVLTLHGKVNRKLPETGQILTEYGLGDFHRVFEVGVDVDPNQIAATLTGGVLTVTLPKKPELRTVRIPVRAG